jgi:hypothetical protein
MSACVPFAPGTSSGTGLLPPRSASRSSSARQSEGAKKSRLSSLRRRSGARRTTASPPPKVRAPMVLPVAKNSSRPTAEIPPCAQMPPPRARVAQLTTLPGSRSGTPTTQPR